MDYAILRRTALYAFIGFLALTALIAIVTVARGNFDEVEIKTLLTTLIITFASLCAMSCLAFSEKRAQPVLALAGFAPALISAVMLIFLVWTNFSNDITFGKTALTCLILGIAFAHAFLLGLPDLGPGHRWAQGAAVATITVLALLLIGLVWGKDVDEGYYRLILIIAILAALMTLVVPILSKLRRPAQEAEDEERLVLTHVHDDVYQAEDGRQFQITPFVADPPVP